MVAHFVFEFAYELPILFCFSSTLMHLKKGKTVSAFFNSQFIAIFLNFFSITLLDFDLL